MSSEELFLHSVEEEHAHKTSTSVALGWLSGHVSSGEPESVSAVLLLIAELFD